MRDDIVAEHGGYGIVPKRDFGQYGYYDSETRTNIKTGFVVIELDFGCNTMPGGCWFKTVEEAMEGIDILNIEVQGPSGR